MSSGSDDELPEWVKTFSSPPIKGKTVAKRRALIVDSDEEDVEPAPRPASAPAKHSESQAGEAIALDLCAGAVAQDLDDFDPTSPCHHVMHRSYGCGS